MPVEKDGEQQVIVLETEDGGTLALPATAENLAALSSIEGETITLTTETSEEELKEVVTIVETESKMESLQDKSDDDKEKKVSGL